MTDDLVPALIAIVLGAAFLYAFFRAVQLKWPESYFGVGDLASYAVSASPWRYVLFRFGPVFVTSLFAAVATDRAGGDGSIAALGIGIAHGCLTSGRALVQSLLWPPEVRRRRRPIMMVWAVVLPGVVLTAVIAGRVRAVFASAIPQVEELASTLWTGLIAGVLGAFIVRISRPSAIHEHEMTEHAAREVPRDLWKLAAKVAVEHAADLNLVRAVMVVEHMQRPRWFRQLEDLKGRFAKSGTYGIMQIRSDEPLSDSESIEIAVKERFAGVRVMSPQGWLDSNALARFAKTYNPSSEYRALLEVAYSTVQQASTAYRSERQAPDYRPVVEVEVFELLNGAAVLSGTAVVPEGTVHISLMRADETVERTVVQASAGGPDRGTWSAVVNIPAGMTAILVAGEHDEETPADVQAESRILIELRRVARC